MAQMIGAPLDVLCPVCQSPVSSACTQPTDTGPRQVLWYHSARVQSYAEAKARGELE